MSVPSANTPRLSTPRATAEFIEFKGFQSRAGREALKRLDNGEPLQDVREWFQVEDAKKAESLLDLNENTPDVRGRSNVSNQDQASPKPADPAASGTRRGTAEFIEFDGYQTESGRKALDMLGEGKPLDDVRKLFQAEGSRSKAA